MKTTFKLLITMLLGIFMLSPAYATPDIAPQPCDTEYWKQMSARAWMEAEREIMQNQNLIFKADSVLEYTCFDQFVNIAAHKGGDIFTHTTYFGQEIIARGTNESMDRALTDVVHNTLISYIGSNFPHKYLGSRAQNLAVGNKNFRPQPPTGPLSGGYACNEMANVWKAAKCANFIDNSAFENTDGFYPFKTIAGHNGNPPVEGYDELVETRKFYASCVPPSLTNYNLGPKGKWTDQIALAGNLPNGRTPSLYPFQTPLAEIYTDVQAKLKPAETAADCSPPIETGIQVVTGNGVSYADGICTNPGCIFNKTGNCIMPAITGTGGLVGGGAGTVITP